MAKQDGLSYYSPGTPGRGKGTILRSPDMTGIFAQAAKTALAQKAQKDTEVEKQQAWLNKVMDLGDKGWSADAEWFANIEKEITDEYVGLLQKYDGQKIPVAELQQITTKANRYKFWAQNSQKNRDDYYRFVASNSKADLDPETREEAASILAQWQKLTPDKRTSLEDFYLEKKFDYTKFTGALAVQVSKQALQKANVGGIQVTPDGKFLNIETYKYTALPLAQELIKNAVITDPMYKRETTRLFKDFMGGDLSKDVTYTYYEEQGNKVVAVTKTQPVTSLEEFIDFQLAPNMVSMQEKKNVATFGGTSIGISMTTPGVDTPLEEPQRYDYTRLTSTGTPVSAEYQAYTYDINTYNKGGKTNDVIQASKDAFTISSLSGNLVKADQSYSVDKGEVHFIPTANADFTYTLKGGKKINVKKGQRIFELPGEPIDAFLKNPQYMNNWDWKANFAIQTKDDNGDRMDFYEEVRAKKGFFGTAAVQSGNQLVPMLQDVLSRESYYNTKWKEKYRGQGTQSTQQEGLLPQPY